MCRVSDARAAAVLRLDAVGPRAEPPLKGRGLAGQHDSIPTEAGARIARGHRGDRDRRVRLDALLPAARVAHRRRLRHHPALLHAHLAVAPAA